MAKSIIHSAIGTPLRSAELHVEGLRAHLADQWDGGMDGVLVAGTMGAMAMLPANAYEQLIEHSAAACRGQGELLVGVGDFSWERTRQRIELANRFEIDGVVVLTPHFFSFSPPELIRYYTTLAELSRTPLYLYDLPQRTGVALTLETICRLAEHPRIAGIKISGDVPKGRRLLRELEGAEFRVFFAEATALDMLVRIGIEHHVDGIYCLVPRLVRSIASAAEASDDAECNRRMGLLDQLLMAVVKYGVFPAISALLNHRGIAGNFAPAPFAALDPGSRDALLAEPGVEAALRTG